MTNRVPKTAADALRMARSWEKAMRLIEEGYSFVNCTTPDSPITLIAVYKPEDAPAAPSYWIRAGFMAEEIPNGCTCPDFVKHGFYCKHTLCWEDMQSMETALAEYEKQQADAECATGCDYRL